MRVRRSFPFTFKSLESIYQHRNSHKPLDQRVVNPKPHHWYSASILNYRTSYASDRSVWTGNVRLWGFCLEYRCYTPPCVLLYWSHSVLTIKCEPHSPKIYFVVARYYCSCSQTVWISNDVSQIQWNILHVVVESSPLAIVNNRMFISESSRAVQFYRSEGKLPQKLSQLRSEKTSTRHFSYCVLTFNASGD